MDHKSNIELPSDTEPSTESVAESRGQSGNSKDDAKIICTSTPDHSEDIAAEGGNKKPKKEVRFTPDTKPIVESSTAEKEPAKHSQKKLHDPFQKICVGQGTPYPCTQAVLDKVLHFSGRNKSPAVTLEQAMLDAIVSLCGPAPLFPCSHGRRNYTIIPIDHVSIKR